jgi:hypothetical protein
MSTILKENGQNGNGSGWTKIIGVVFALILTAALFAGYLFLRNRHNQLEAEKQAALTVAKPAPSPLIEVVQDEARLKGSAAVLNGTVKNISSGPLKSLIVDFLLTPRAGEPETRSIELNPGDLAPGEQASYSLTLSREFKSANVARIRTKNDTTAIAFRTVAGAKRPLEGPPETKTVIIKKPAIRSGGEEFINTYDNPARIH